MKYEVFKVFDLEKISSNFINFPKLPKKYNLRRGIYMWIYKNIVIKVGLFGEGTQSGASGRYSSYRTTNKHLSKYIKGINKTNGSVRPILTLLENLSIGDKVEVIFKEAPDNMHHNGYPYKVDLVQMEAEHKEQHKETLWLK